MPTPAIVQVRDAMAAVIAAALAGHTVIIDRDRNDAITTDEMPACLISIPDADFELFDSRDTLMHTADFVIEIYERESAGASIAVQQQFTVATINAALMADYTIGGRLQNLVVIGTTGGEENPSDVGAIALSVRAMWLTPADDFLTIIGQSGLFT